MDNVCLEMVREKLDMDRKIIEYLDTHIADRVAIEHKIRALEFHKAVLDLIDKARTDGVIDVSPSLTAEEIFILLELGVLSSKQEKRTESN